MRGFKCDKVNDLEGAREGNFSKKALCHVKVKFIIKYLKLRVS